MILRECYFFVLAFRGVVERNSGEMAGEMVVEEMV